MYGKINYQAKRQEENHESMEEGEGEDPLAEELID